MSTKLQFRQRTERKRFRQTHGARIWYKPEETKSRKATAIVRRPCVDIASMTPVINVVR